MGFKLWYSNYCSNKSALLMSSTLRKTLPGSISLPTNKQLAARVANLYKANDCWTWYDDYEWWTHDVFLGDNNDCSQHSKLGESFPVNMINIQLPRPKASRLRRLVRKPLGALRKALSRG